MLKKVVITSIGFFVLALILGFVALRESVRMEVSQDKQEAETIEQGALVYADKCATCHGEHARAERCFINSEAYSGEQIGCAGLPLNTLDLLCNNNGRRLIEEHWEGTTREYILTLTTIGRTEKGMPAFRKAFVFDEKQGLSNTQIENVTDRKSVV